MKDAPAALDGPTIFVPYVHAFGGVERLILGLSRFLHRAGRPHTLLCFEDRVGLAARAGWPVEVRALHPRRHALSEARALARVLKDLRHPPLLFDLKGAFYAGLGRQAGFALHLTDPPSLLESDITRHAFSFPGEPAGDAAPRPGLLRRMRGEAAHRVTLRGVRSAARVIVMSHRIRDEIRRLYGVEAEVVRPGVPEPEPGALGESLSRPRYRILSVCRLETSKNVSWLIRAFARHAVRLDRPEGRPWQLDLVGAGRNEAELRREVTALGLQEHVVFHGALDDLDLAPLYGEAALAALPGAQGYGLPALEALAAGVPLVLNEGAGVSEILRDSSWIEVTGNDEAAFARGFARQLARLGSSAFSASPPSVPTEHRWAEGVCRAAGWLA